MPRHEITLQAFVSSPNDVSEERAMLEDIVRELNLTWSKSLGMRIELIKWETHVTPGIGQDVQQVINSQIGDDYDIFIGIMWARFGTETGRFGSGTEEEFERVYNRYLKDQKSVEIMFYFKDAGVQPSEVDLEQLSRVLAFKRRLGPKGTLYGTYTSRESLTVVKAMLASLRQMQQGNVEFIKIIAASPRVTSALNRARRRTVAVLEKLGIEVKASINLVSEIEKLFLDLLEKNRGSMVANPPQEVKSHNV